MVVDRKIISQQNNNMQYKKRTPEIIPPPANPATDMAVGMYLSLANTEISPTFFVPGIDLSHFMDAN